MPDIYKLDIEGKTIWPGTSTSAVVDPDARVSLKGLLETWNISTLWPEEDVKTLESAINLLATKLPADRKILGTKVEFKNDAEELEGWEWIGGKNIVFENPIGWRRLGGKAVSDIENVVFPLESNIIVTPKVIEKGVATPVTIEWTITKKGVDITDSCEVLFNNAVADSPKTMTLNEPNPTNLKYPFKVTAGGEGEMETEIEIPVVAPIYFGSMRPGTPNGSTLQNLWKFVEIPGTPITRKNEMWEYKSLIVAVPVTSPMPTSLKDDSGLNYLPGMNTIDILMGGIVYKVWYQEEGSWISQGKDYTVNF